MVRDEIAAYCTPAITHVFHVAADPHTFPGTSNADDHKWEKMESLGPEKPSSNRDGCAAVLATAPNILPDKLAYVVADALIGASLGEQSPFFRPEAKGKGTRNDQRWRDVLRTDLSRFFWLLVGLSGKAVNQGGLAAARSECAELFGISIRAIRGVDGQLGWEKEISKIEAATAETAGAAMAGDEWTTEAKGWWKSWCLNLECQCVEDVAIRLCERYRYLYGGDQAVEDEVRDRFTVGGLMLVKGR